jgi:hypothetical protein
MTHKKAKLKSKLKTRLKTKQNNPILPSPETLLIYV